MEGAGRGVHERLGDGVGVDPADLGVLAGFAVLGFAGPFVGGEDDGEEAVGCFDVEAQLPDRDEEWVDDLLRIFGIDRA